MPNIKLKSQSETDCPEAQCPEVQWSRILPPRPSAYRGKRCRLRPQAGRARRDRKEIQWALRSGCLPLEISGASSRRAEAVAQGSRRYRVHGGEGGIDQDQGHGEEARTGLAERCR